MQQYHVAIVILTLIYLQCFLSKSPRQIFSCYQFDNCRLKELKCLIVTLLYFHLRWPLCIRECGGTRFNWASSDFSLRFTHLSPLPLISPVHDPFIYIRRTTRNVRQIFLVLSNRDEVVQTLSNGEQTQEIFSCVSYSCGKHWFAADRTFPTDR